jgi:hypothetical protein
MTYRIAFPLLAFLAAGACNTKDATARMSQKKSLSLSAAERQAVSLRAR